MSGGLAGRPPRLTHLWVFGLASPPPPFMLNVGLAGRPVADPGGGGGVQGVRTPLLGHDVGFLTLGPKLGPLLDPPPLFLLVDLRWTPVADPGCVCVTGVITPPPPMLVNVQEWGCFSRVGVFF